jgi:major membrane immunogen (membrane-anchored lipoprotein)
MPIPESQLDTWAKQGSITQSQATYKTVRGVLEGSDAAYAKRDYAIFLQGSYGNDTNIYADSDVDVVIRMDDIHYTDLDALSNEDNAAYQAARTTAEYSYKAFKSEVVAQLTKHFGSDVDPGNKAVLVKSNGSRRDADVLPSALLRKYTRFKSWNDRRYIEGICFWDAKGTMIINYPKQHSENCTTKHQNTNTWFKPMVRIIKNMRNAMIDDGYLKAGIAPSYFLEGLLYNVPNGKFGTSYEDTFVNAINWIIEIDRSKFVCANEQYYLCHPTSPVTWRKENLQTFLDAAIKYWKDW